MKSRGMHKAWYCSISKHTTLVIESQYCGDTFKNIWREIIKYFDNDKPRNTCKVTEMSNKLEPILKNYLKENISIIGEVPNKKGIIKSIKPSNKFSAYYNVPIIPKRVQMDIDVNDYQETCAEIAEKIEHGINFLRVEASEILAFVVTDSERINTPGIPPHLPVAYGLKGHSLPMKTMLEMLNDVRNALHAVNASILCEVYDGQFHSIIVKNSNGQPLTRIQFMLQKFREVMRDYDKQELLLELDNHSKMNEEDLEELKKLKFKNGATRNIGRLSLAMKKVCKRDNVIRRHYLETIPINNFGMKDITTKHREDLWNRYLRNRDNALDPKPSKYLSSVDLHKFLEGTKVHRRITRRNVIDEITEITDSDRDDSDYVPDENAEISESDSDTDTDEFTDPNLSTITATSTGESCIKIILRKLKAIDNKHKWSLETVDTFIQKYLSSKKGIEKLFAYELDIICNEIFECFGKQIFQKNDKKSQRVNKLFSQLKSMPQLLRISTSDEENMETYQCRSLIDICTKFLTCKDYPKELLAAPICDKNHYAWIKEWEEKSPIPIKIPLDFINDTHIIFNYPEINSDRKQIEMRTFDYTHILNNLRFHICNRGFRGVSTQAFINVSKSNHDILPRAIVEDKMDRQNSSISERFFSEDVEKILKQNGDESEALFVRLTRDWFNACDKRGMPIEDRLEKLQTMYEYMIGKCNLSDYPPPGSHIEGIPIKTYEALLHSISTRFSLFGLSSKQKYNTRSISTLAVESFFSDLTRYEFSGLGAPKAVDIPKLLSHVVHINTLKHNPDRGFEFTTSTRDNYPTILLENETDITNDGPFCSSNFEVPSLKKGKTKRWFNLSKPKEVTKGAKGVRQYFKIDESKLSAEQRLGQEVDIENCDT